MMRLAYLPAGAPTGECEYVAWAEKHFEASRASTSSLGTGSVDIVASRGVAAEEPQPERGERYQLDLPCCSSTALAASYVAATGRNLREASRSRWPHSGTKER